MPRARTSWRPTAGRGARRARHARHASTSGRCTVERLGAQLTPREVNDAVVDAMLQGLPRRHRCCPVHARRSSVRRRPAGLASSSNREVMTWCSSDGHRTALRRRVLRGVGRGKPAPDVIWSKARRAVSTAQAAWRSRPPTDPLNAAGLACAILERALPAGPGRWRSPTRCRGSRRAGLLKAWVAPDCRAPGALGTSPCSNRALLALLATARHQRPCTRPGWLGEEAPFGAAPARQFNAAAAMAPDGMAGRRFASDGGRGACVRPAASATTAIRRGS